MKRSRRHSNTQGVRGSKTGSRARKLKRLASKLRIPYGLERSSGEDDPGKSR